MKAIAVVTLAFVAAASLGNAEDDRAKVAGVYLYEEGARRFVLCLPKSGNVSFSVYRSVAGKLQFVSQTFANPGIVDGRFKVRRNAFRIDQISRTGWPIRREISQTHLEADKEDRDVEWRYERVSLL